MTADDRGAWASEHPGAAPSDGAGASASDRPPSGALAAAAAPAPTRTPPAPRPRDPAAKLATRPLFVYVHIQKTGGTSMRAAVESLFGPDRVFWHGKDGMVNELRDAGEMRRLAGYDVVGGHFPAALVTAELVGRPVMLVGLVRNPIHQIISHYEYVRTRPDNRLHSPLSLLEVASQATEFAAYSRALQARMLTGRTNGDLAFEALEKIPHLVGTIDRAQEVVDRLAELAGIAREVRVGRINVAPRGYRQTYEDSATMDAVRPLAHQDFRFFRRVVRVGGVSERLPVEA